MGLVSSLGGSKTISLPKGMRVKIEKMIGEGGYSYVYVARDTKTRGKYALKKVLCQVPEQVAMVRREAAVHDAFAHPHLMPLLDFAWTKAPGGRGDVAWLLLPLAAGGSLRAHLDRRLGLPAAAAGAARSSSSSSGRGGGGGGLAEGELLRLFWGICKGVEALHQHVPSWAHRDLKPDNVLLYGDGTPVLIDFGSVADANVVITNRNEALQLQDAAAQFCTVSYRAPELFDVASSATVDCRTDVWSLGCTLYAMAFGYSPFESEIGPDNQIRVVDCTFLRVIGKVSYPKYHKYSENLLELISFMLEQDPKKRPFIGDIIDKLLKMEPNLGRLSQDVINTFGSPKKTTAATIDMLDASSIV